MPIYKALDAALLQQYPAADMAVLAKYNKAARQLVTYHSKVHLPDGRVVELPYHNMSSEYNFRKLPTMEVYNTPLIPTRTYDGMFSIELTKLHRSICTQWDEWCAVVSKLRDDYKATYVLYDDLIQKSRTLEEVEKVWPEASVVREFF